MPENDNRSNDLALIREAALEAGTMAMQQPSYMATSRTHANAKRSWQARHMPDCGPMV